MMYAKKVCQTYIIVIIDIIALILNIDLLVKEKCIK